MPEAPPTGGDGQLAQLGERKSPLSGKARIVPGHRIAINQFGHRKNTRLGKTRAAQIGDQSHTAGQLATPSEQTDGVGFIQMVQHEIAEHNVIKRAFGEIEKVGANKSYLGKPGGKFLRDFQGWLLAIDRRHQDGATGFACTQDEGPRNIRAARAEIEDTQWLTACDDRTEIIEHQAVRSEPMIERFKIGQIGLQLGSCRFDHVHPFRSVLLEAADHGTSFSAASILPVRPRSTR